MMRDVIDETFFNDNSVTYQFNGDAKDFYREIRGLKSGIYCFYDVMDNPIYLGRSIRLPQRIKEHIGGGGYSPLPRTILPIIKNIKILPTIKFCHADFAIIERRLINEIRPLLNNEHVKYENLSRKFSYNEPLGNIVKAIEEFTGAEFPDKFRIIAETQQEEPEDSKDKEVCVNAVSKVIAVRESIKLVIQHKESEEADKIIDELIKLIGEQAS